MRKPNRDLNNRNWTKHHRHLNTELIQVNKSKWGNLLEKRLEEVSDKEAQKDCGQVKKTRKMAQERRSLKRYILKGTVERRSLNDTRSEM